MSEMTEVVDHLNGFDCSCGHTTMAHYRNPACRFCRCSNDPKCWCGLLASKHVEERA